MFKLVLFISILAAIVFVFEKDSVSMPQKLSIPLSKPSQTAKTSLLTPPESKLLKNDYHIYQTFNNCGPAALSMALSYYGINESQKVLGDFLRPYQNPPGDNDDKSVTLEELAEKAQEYNLIPYHRPNGTIDLIKLFISYDMSVITRTWLKENEDIGHYRVVKGYDDTTREFIQDDSLQGKNLRYAYKDFNVLWEKFNFEYLVLVPQDKKAIAETILGDQTDTIVSWQKAVKRAEESLIKNPNDPTSRFNLSVALYNTKDYQQAVDEYEKVETKLSFRTLWYQIEPIQAYYQLGNYERVFAITDKILNNHNRAFSELYIIRGNMYKTQGNLEAARSEFEKALLYKSNFTNKIPQL